MLRLTATSQSECQVVLAVDGWVAGVDVALLEQEIARQLGDAEELVLDLGGVRFIDKAGLALLERWSGHRLVLRGGSSFVRALLETHRLL